MSRWSNWPAPMGLMSTPREPLQGPMRQPGQLLASQENGATARILGEAAGAYLGQARVPIEGLVAIGVTPPATGRPAGGWVRVTTTGCSVISVDHWA
jgi:hypothetical protein